MEHILDLYFSYMFLERLFEGAWQLRQPCDFYEFCNFCKVVITTWIYQISGVRRNHSLIMLFVFLKQTKNKGNTNVQTITR